jgi:uncharacterized CHY-type Zn-finger protein
MNPCQLKPPQIRRFSAWQIRNYLKFSNTQQMPIHPPMLKKANEQCIIISVIKGEISIDDEKIGLGEQCISPFGEECEVRSEDESSFLVTRDFHYQTP